MFKNISRWTVFIWGGLALLFAYLAVTNYQTASAGFWPMEFMDEYSNQKKTWVMLDSLLTGDPIRFFASGIYGYGCVFYVVNLIFNSFFILTGNDVGMLLMPRMIVLVCYAYSLLYFYKLARDFLSERNAWLLTALIATFPASSFIAISGFLPNWAATLFVVLSVYYLSKDKFRYERFYYFGVLSFGLALAIKLQALILLHLVFVYIFAGAMPLFPIQWKSIFRCVTKSIQAGLLLFFVYFLGNPYVIHPIGLIAIKRGVDVGVTEQSVAYVPSLAWWSQFFKVTIDDLFMPFVLFVGLFLVLIYLSWQYFRTASSLFNVLALTSLVSLVYLLFIGHMQADRYYVQVMILSVAAMIVVLKRYSPLKQTAILLIILLIQGAYFLPIYRNIVPRYSKEVVAEKEVVNTIILSVLEKRVDVASHVLVSPTLGFEYEKLGLSYQQIHVIRGPLDTWMINETAYKERYKQQGELGVKVFRPASHIILAKSGAGEPKEEVMSSLVLALLDGSLGFDLIKETDSFWIFEFVADS